MLTLMLMFACGGDAKDTAADGPTFDPADWSGGDFDFLTVAANDQCLGGALEALFMPDGPGTPNSFEYPTYLPGYGELPMAYTIDLRDPFVSMPVNVDSDDGVTFAIRGSLMESVPLGAAAYGDCTVTMSVDADVTPSSADAVDGFATITVTEPRGSDGRCPVFDVEPCQVELDLAATRN